MLRVGRKIHKIFLSFLFFSLGKGPNFESRAAPRQLATLVPPPRGRVYLSFNAFGMKMFDQFIEIIDLCEENGTLMDVRQKPQERGTHLLTDDY